MDFREIEYKIEKIEDLRWKMLEKAAAEVFESEIRPFLDSRRLNFVSAHGDYAISTSCDKNRIIYLDNHPSERFSEIFDILEIDVGNQPFGSFMPDYIYVRE